MTERVSAAQALLARLAVRNTRSPRESGVPELVCTTCAELLPVTGATVSLMAHTGHRYTVGASDRTGFHIEQLQFTLGEGPSIHAFTTGSPVLVEDVAVPDERWPLFGGDVSEWGVRAVHALPLQQDGITIGVLGLYSDFPGAPTEAEQAEFLLMAEAVRTALLTYLHHDPPTEPIAGSSEDSGVSEAIGMVMEQLGTNANTALARMRAAAFVAGNRLTDVAREITDRSLRFDDDTR